MLNDFLDGLPRDILREAQDLKLKISSVHANEAIDRILAQTVLKGGKRLRPLLTFLAADLFGVSVAEIYPYARACELVHGASLAHDDVVDNATLRRGLPSINVLASNKRAVLAGDYLLSQVIVDLAHAGNIDLVREMSLVIQDLSEGEWLQLDLLEGRQYTKQTITEVAYKKTSSVMSYCLLAPAVLGGAPKVIIEEARQFGKLLGLAFQMIDDTLDTLTTSEKDQKLDLQNGIVNSVTFEVLSEHPGLMMAFRDGADLSKLLDGVSFENAITRVTKESQEHLQKASLILDYFEGHFIDKKRQIDHLRKIVFYIGKRTL